jgi:Asp-tRNA(Asn)/Glu-tRNA(Gln) amidotransferase A subunit family amidase
MKRLNELTASEIAQAIAGGKTTAEAVARACLERVVEREPRVQAWQFIDSDLVLKQARALDARGGTGPLQGVPIGMKDIIDTHDMPTEYGSPIYKGHRPVADAACVALSRRAGALIMGKTVTTEFANRHPGKTMNPFDPARTPGGSSSGSAAAVGDFMVPLAVGTQTTASTIRPASFCGAVGYRPTWGDIRCVGVKEAAGSLDTVGLIARSVDDIALYRDVLVRAKPEPIETPVNKPRIGFCRTPVWDQAETHTQNALENLARDLAARGADVRDVSLPSPFARIPEAHRWISSFEFSRNFSWEIENHWELISETLRNGRLKDGLSCTFEQYREARDCAESCRAMLNDAFGDRDVVLVPAAAGEAPVGLNATGNAAFCAIWTTMHVPAMTLPMFKGPNGLPIGAQFVARRNADRKLMAACKWIERTFSARAG